MEPRPEFEELVTKHELERLLGFSDRWIEQKMRDPSDPLPYLRFGRAVRFQPTKVQQWLERRSVG